MDIGFCGGPPPRKRLLSASSEDPRSSRFTFSCTGCGRCCRQLSSRVLLDPADAWSLRVYAGAGADGGGATWPLRGTQRALGLFQASALPARPTPAPPRASGLAPVLFLDPADAGDGDVRCAFAAVAAAGGSRSAAGEPAALTCTLGPGGMPYACALYPLGDFWSGGGGGTALYSLDDSGACEGVEPAANNSSILTPQPAQSPPTPPPPPRPQSSAPARAAERSVGEYAAANALAARRAAAEAHRSLATAVACSGLVERGRARVRGGGAAVAAAAAAAGGAAPALGWLAPAVAALAGSLPPRARGWRDVRGGDVLARLLLDRLAALWYDPVRAGAVAPGVLAAARADAAAAAAAGSPPPALPRYAGAGGAAEGIERATADLVAAWPAVVRRAELA